MIAVDELVGPAPLLATDPVTVEVIRRRLVAIADQVDVNITRTAFSPYIYEYKDYAVAIVDRNGGLICQCSGGIPIFVADVLGASVRDGLSLYGHKGFERGDIIITNYSGTVGQHLNNVVMYTPVYANNGADLVAFMIVVMHWVDVGGKQIGSVSLDATEIFQEGIQLRTIKLHRKGERVEDVYRIIEHNTRLPVSVLGDIASQVGGCYMGRDEIEVLIRRYGLETYKRALEAIWAQSEKAAKLQILAIPNGEYTASTFLDSDGLTSDEPLLLAVTVIVDDDRLILDFSNVAAQAKSPINSGISGGGQTVARLAFRYLIVPEGDVNEGTFRPLGLVLPEGTIISASALAPMGSYNVPLPSLIDLVIKALSPVMPFRTSAGHFGTFSSLMITGRAPLSDALFQCHDSGFGGWGALHDQDGPGPFRTMCHGDTRLIPIEVQEASYPLEIEEFTLRTDSGGAGEFRGGLGLKRVYRVLADCTARTRFDRTKFPPWGLNGGGDGAPGDVEVVRPDGSRQSGLRDNLKLSAGDRLVVYTGGGGGHGVPTNRDNSRVQNDIRQGYVSENAACSIYGLKLGEGGIHEIS